MNDRQRKTELSGQKKSGSMGKQFCYDNQMIFFCCVCDTNITEQNHNTHLQWQKIEFPSIDL